MTEGRIEKQKKWRLPSRTFKSSNTSLQYVHEMPTSQHKKKDKQKQYQSVKLHGIKTLDDE